ncbi:transposase [Paraburkholderia antibiotica]|uniref:Transposase n=1 Tax=Paraburkholderia antibiotica TaxID=2728839 RepID=A0A7X9ZY99_9BURK|nr:transposase [Paraburkholderia antibiotica]NML32706.1 transposase [Paraburkholderia antibiotica]
MLTQHRDITDQEWQRVMKLLPELRPRTELRGRPQADTRSVLNGVLWVIYSGAVWSAMPRRYPAYQTCHRRFKNWYDKGVLSLVMVELFGEAGAELYDTIKMRMRNPVIFTERSLAGRRVPNVSSQPPFVSATSVVVPSQSFNHRPAFRREA